jgi:hypothetical protein
MNDFSRKTLAALARKGIKLVGLQAIPTGKFADYERGYRVDDNGCGRVLTFNEVLALV